MSEETELIKERLDIATVVGEYVRLTPAGKSLKGLCPFHQEKSPSFIVSAGRGTWHCFGCSEGGDVFTFIQKIEGLDFPAALKLLAERAGVVLKKQNVQSTNARVRLFELLEQAALFYQAVLVKHAAGKKALAYLRERGIIDETVATFQIGYAPPAWDSLQQALKRRGFTDEEMIQSGMAGKSQRGSLYDRFRGRIMFPVRDTQGRVVAFGGRIVPWHETGNEGKYVNSPETMLYEKRRVVYNLHRAKEALRGNKPCVVVEGYMDVVLLEQAGWRNVVATSGTAFTAEHVQQLGRFTNTVHFAFDGDGAGWKATLSATTAALSAGMHVQTIVLPDGMDPADIVVKRRQELDSIMGATRPLLHVLFEQLRTSEDGESREKQLAALLPLLSQVRNPIVQGEMIRDAADILAVPEQSVRTMLERETAGRAAPAARLPLGADTIGETARLPDLEQYTLGLMVADEAARQEWFPVLEEDLFIDGQARKLYGVLVDLAQSEADFFSLATDSLLSALPDETVPLAEALAARAGEMLNRGSVSASQEAGGAVRELRRRHLQSRLKLLLEKQMHGNDQEKKAALTQYRALLQELAVLVR